MNFIIMLSSLVIMVIIGVPICFSLGASSIIYILIANPSFLIMLPQRMWSGTDSFVMIALPLFILAGQLMNSGGITKRIINFCLYLVKPIRGGLGEVNVVASMIFGGISGSSVADTSAIGSILIPSMIKKGYSMGFSAGITVASSTMGMIIPPSIPMLLYAKISEESVAALFLAGLVPGILIGLTQIIMVNILSRRHNYHPIYIKFKMKDFMHTSYDGALAIIMPLIIVITVSFGIATASESAGIAVLYSLVLGFFIYRELKIRDLGKMLKQTLITSASIMFIIAFAMIYTWILAVERVPHLLGDFILGLNIHKNWILLFFDFFILFTGTFIDVTPSLFLLCPILIPVMGQLGVNTLHFGTIMIVGLAVSLVTPPVGMCLNAATKICGMPITKIFRHAIPFLICNVIILILVTFVPAISLWLPGLIIK